MANINLLPWRDEYRQEKKREFFSILCLLCLLGLLVAYVWVSYTKSLIDRQQQRNQLLKTEIAALEQKVAEIAHLERRREELEARIQIIQDLQVKRPLIVRYFDGMVRAVPEGLYFNTLKRTADVFSIQGITESNTRVSTLMRNLDRSQWFAAPNLKNVIADEFELDVESVDPNAAVGEEG
ncbi:MAG: PilN domain-containing protein [Cellvibrionaceae bacterium]|nr:PilN domain-containing protein [Cellvibrionaceae bacterium]